MTTPDIIDSSVGAAFLTWLTPAEFDNFVRHSANVADRVTELTTIGLPLLAVLIVSQIKPALA